MSNVVQWGVDQLFAKLRDIQRGAEAERVTISTNNGRLVALNAKVQALPPSTQKTQLLAWIKGSVARQGQLVAAWKALSARFASLSAKVQAWLRSAGINPSDAGLSGLGEMGVVWVPVALVALAVAAWGAYAYIHQRNQVQLKAIALHEQAFNALVKAGATPAELAAFIKDADAQTKQLEPKPGDDPFGIGALAGLVPWLVIGGALVMFGPQLMAAARSRRATA